MQADLIRPISEALDDGAWQGRRAFVIGGGSSLADFDFSRLAGELTIGINAGIYLKPPPTIAYAADIRFMQMVEAEGSWTSLPSLKVVHNCIKGQAESGMLKPETMGGTYYLPIKRKGGWGHSLSKGDERCGAVAAGFSGAVCLNLADILGASPIYMMGFDCYRNQNTSHYHDKYPDDWKTADCMYDKFRRVLNSFVSFPKADVYHLRSPGAPPSGADAFSSMVYDDVLPGGSPEIINFEATTDECV